MISELEVLRIVSRAFAIDFCVDEDAAREAVRDGRLFNLMHMGSGIKAISREDLYAERLK